MVKHAGKRLHVRAIDLGGSAAEVAAQIAELASWIESRAMAGMSA